MSLIWITRWSPVALSLSANQILGFSSKIKYNLVFGVTKARLTAHHQENKNGSTKKYFLKVFKWPTDTYVGTNWWIHIQSYGDTGGYGGAGETQYDSKGDTGLVMMKTINNM